MTSSNYDSTIHMALIEDEVLLGEMLAKQLANQQGIHVLFTAQDGELMVDKIAAHGVPHIVLMDIQMPGMNGYRSTRWLREHHKSVGILALSGMEDPDAFTEIIECGAHGFVSKDQPFDELLVAIKEVFRKKKYNNPFVDSRQFPASRYGFMERFIDLLNIHHMRILSLLATGLSNQEIAEQANMSTASVKKNLEALFGYFGVRNRLELVKKVNDLGLLCPLPLTHQPLGKK